MRSRFRLLAGAGALTFVLGAAPAFAGPSPCISTTGHGPAGIGGYGSSSGCQYLVTVNANGSITLTNQSATNGSNYESNEDVEVGVIDNYTAGTLSGLALTGYGIGNFENDGIDAYGGTSNARDTTGYGGPNTYFTNNTVNALNALFVTALTTGQSTYFSLEEPPTIGSGSLSVTGIPTPEPSSLALIGVAMLGIFMVRKRHA